MSRKTILTLPDLGYEALVRVAAQRVLPLSHCVSQLALEADAKLKGEVAKEASASMTPARASKAKEATELAAKRAKTDAWWKSERGELYMWCESAAQETPFKQANATFNSPENVLLRDEFVDFVMAYPGGREAWKKQFRLDHPKAYLDYSHGEPAPNYPDDPRPEFKTKNEREGSGVPRQAHEYWDDQPHTLALRAWYDRHPEARRLA